MPDFNKPKKAVAHVCILVYRFYGTRCSALRWALDLISNEPRGCLPGPRTKEGDDAGVCNERKRLKGVQYP